MDWGRVTQTGTELLKKYRYVLVVVLVGLFLMLLPESDPLPDREPEAQMEESLEEALEELLSQLKGAGKVSVLLTEKQGKQIIYQTDEDAVREEDATDVHTKTVLVTEDARKETGLVRQIIPPVLQGAVVLCQGADDPKIRLAVVEAVMGATGLPSHCICVLKMK